MVDITTIPSHRPRCPNHGEVLEGVGFPLPKKGTGTCPVSGVPFSFEVESDDTAAGDVKDKFGNISKTGRWKVSGND